MSVSSLLEILRNRSRYLLLVAVIGLSPLSLAQSGELFPRPASLEPAIQFWIKVYTEVDTRHGFLHDAVNLAVIYDSVPQSRRDREARREQIQEDLRILGTGQRNRLTASQKEILALWGEDVADETLRAAASSVRFQLGQSDRFLGGLRRSGAFRPHIESVIAEKNLPIELAVLPHVESSFNPNAYSSASAAGMWQFGSATGKRFMRIDHIVDERMDPYNASAAAMSLLEYNYSVLGTWPLALTAYNHGAGGISRAVRATGTTDIATIVKDYKGRAFGFASRNFYAQFLAVLEVEFRASEFFGNVDFDSAPNFIEVSTDAFIDAEVLARSLGISLEQLQADNRGLRPVVWEGNKRIPRGYTIKVRESAVAATQNLMALVPDDFKFGVQTPDLAYVVERGDSLSVIARRFNTSVARLASLNSLPSRHRIQIGQRLLLPQDNSAATLAANTPRSASDGTYTVNRGDTVSVIAGRFGVSAAELLQLNGLSDPDRIYPGQALRLPGFDHPDPSTGAIAANEVPRPPVEVAFASEEVTGSGEDATERGETIEVVASTEEPAASASQLALVADPLPPAAVLPDNQVLEAPVSAEEELAEAIDPAVDDSANEEELNEVLLADPSDYTVADNNSIEIQASETLGHYAEWLNLRAQDLRRVNNMSYRTPLIIGNRLQLDFSAVSITRFEQQRRAFHSQLQRNFFSAYSIQGVENYKIKANDNIGTIARNRYSTPFWLLRQYNPGLDFNRIQIDQEIVFPLLQATQ